MALPHLTPDELEAFGAELDDLRRRTIEDLGERDRAYLERVVRAQRGLEATGRALLFAGFLPPAWLGGTAALSLSKILENMEVGHNVMHGQYDFLQDPAFQGGTYDWDNACPGDAWRHSHNVRHHTFTNVVGEDRDIGYGVVRIDESTPWHPANLGNPLYALALATFFQYGVMLHDLELDRVLSGERTWDDLAPERDAVLQKLAGQTMKDYVLWPALTGPLAPLTLAANATANLARNLWSFTIIFCGHFPEDVATFTAEEAADESRGAWYLRQLLGSANIDGGPLFHVLSGNLSHQIEHHLFSDLPAHRYAEMAVEVREICERYGLPYHSGGLAQQVGSVARKIVRFALPWSRSTPPDAPTGARASARTQPARALAHPAEPAPELLAS